MSGLVLVVAQLLAQVDGSQCSQVRNVRAMARSNGLDERTLEALEAKYCSGAPVVVVPMPGAGSGPGPAAPPPPLNKGLVVPPPKANADCVDLWMMSVLARVAGGDPRLLSDVNAEVSTACSQPARSGPLRWANGQLLRDEAGWWYPNGTAAKNASGWWYLTRNAARVAATGNWFYPDGKMAKNAGRWYRPGGAVKTPEEIANEACPRATDDCSSKKYALKVTEGDSNDVVLLELAWSLR